MTLKFSNLKLENGKQSNTNVRYVCHMQARRTLFKTGTARVASKITELGVWGAL